ncbi:iron ABC transporter permease, partial [Xanthobacter autotrophicus]|uniref:iron chelate uptake ABC transporter family permease subunit n=2 Tax=Xanthobacter TaxID=279 RepID=UPI0024AC06DF
MTAPPISHTVLIATLGTCVALLLAASVAVGYAPLDLGAAIADLAAGRQSLPALVLAELRLPRAILGAAVGFSLGVTGAALQGLMRNPLA